MDIRKMFVMMTSQPALASSPDVRRAAEETGQRISSFEQRQNDRMW